jgi:outer membrane protein OmpA-like peptidoglycan-associated protein
MKNISRFGKVTIVSFLLSGLISINAQEADRKNFQKDFQNADMYYYYDEDYLRAASMYEPLQKENPDNYNLAAKLGICYLNLDGKEQDALRLLKKASEGVVSNEKEYKETGDKAPLDTYLYLAIAFHRNDSLDQALTFLNRIKTGLSDSDTYQEDFVDLQIRNVRYAMEMKKRPVRVISELFAPWLSDYPGACNPVLSKNDSVFVFTVKNEGSTQVYCSYKNGTWEIPVNITDQLGGWDRFYTNSITGDGRTLILFMDDGGDGNLYYSERQNRTWSKVKSVGRYVNSIYWEAHGFITPDGQTMYFSSNRPGGEGELDIWTSQRLPDGSWDKPVNCGNTINTPWDETSPYYDTENNALLFSSIGHISMGGYDVFRSTNRGAGVWTQPVGMPYSFNTVQENTNFVLNNNAPGFIVSRFDNQQNKRNIYSIVGIDPADELTKASGTIKLEDGMKVDPEMALVTVKNISSGEINQNISIAEDGTFSFDIKPGDYEVYVSHDGYNTDTISLNLPLYFTGSFLAVEPSLEPEKVSAGDFLSIQNILFDFDKSDVNEDAKPTLEMLRNIIVSYPELTIEVAGYTDAKGSTEYNRRLADRRAQSVIDYFTSSGIDAGRFIKKALGESNFLAINTNSDGTDNPEGRAYNRRVSFGIINPNTGIVIHQEAFTPRHLRQPGSMKYSIILMQTDKKLYPSYFSNLIKDEMLFIRTIETDSINMYALGVFYTRPDAATYLEYLREQGLKDAYIINQFDLENYLPKLVKVKEPADQTLPARKIFTIQMKATKGRIDIQEVFPGYEGVVETYSEDGFYKYTYGEFTSISKALEVLVDVKKDYDDAFIREVDIPINR